MSLKQAEKQTNKQQQRSTRREFVLQRTIWQSFQKAMAHKQTNKTPLIKQERFFVAVAFKLRQKPKITTGRNNKSISGKEEGDDKMVQHFVHLIRDLLARLMFDY